MRIESKLCHITENKVIVKASGWVNDKKVGSSLAEAETVEMAEDKAISRLINRVGQHREENSSNTNLKVNSSIKDKITKSTIHNKTQSINAIEEPNDWSNELTSIDIQLRRLRWSKEDENDFLEKKFGYNNRTKITKYTELIKY